jgi:hypothetical protein
MKVEETLPMHRSLLCVAICILLSPVLFAEESKSADPNAVEEFPGPVLNITKTAQPPAIDGTLDDAAWKDAANSDKFFLKEGSKAQGKTKLYVTRDDNALYIGVECFDSEAALKALKCEAKDHDTDSVWGDDALEVFVDPSGKRDSYYQLIINSKNVVWDAWHASPGNPDKSWNPEIKVATKVGKESWTCEIALPFAVLTQSPKSEANWAFNVTRHRPAAGELTFWSPVYNDGNHHPDKFGKLTGMPAVVLKTPEKK